MATRVAVMSSNPLPGKMVLVSLLVLAVIRSGLLIGLLQGTRAILVTGTSSVPRSLVFAPHCHDHKGEKGYAILTYELLKTGQCIMTARLCHKDNPDYKLWLCLADPTGFVSGIFVEGDTIVRGGYGTRRQASWAGKAGPFKDFWICPDGVIR